MPTVIEKQLAGLVFGYDYMIDTFNDYAAAHFNMKDPYEDEEGNRLKLPEYASREDQKIWRRVQRQAWRHDKCFMGSCGVGMDCGLGLGPLVVILPVVGPYLMYIVHRRSISFISKKYPIPGKMKAKMHSQILVDLLISLPPIIGVLLSWMNGCSTRNATLIYKYMVVRAENQARQEGRLGNESEVGYKEVRQPQQAWLDRTRQH